MHISQTDEGVNMGFPVYKDERAGGISGLRAQVQDPHTHRGAVSSLICFLTGFFFASVRKH